MPTLREVIVATAREEAQKGRPWVRGGEIDRLVLDPYRPVLLELGHLSKGDPGMRFSWCAAWACFVLRKSGVVVPKRWGNHTTALCSTLELLSKRLGAWRQPGVEPSPGDLVMLNWDSDKAPDHVGILLMKDAGAFFSLAEGNRRDQEAIVQRRKSMALGSIDVVSLARALVVLEKEGMA